MESDNTFNSSILFALFADNNISLWEKIIGCEVEHYTYGVGKIEGIRQAGNTIYIDFEFIKSLKKTFTCKSFIDGYFKNIDMNHFPVEGFNEFYEMKIREKKDRLIREEAEAKFSKEFNLLKQKYGMSISNFSSIASPLYMILLKFESSEELNEEDIQWLNRNNLSKLIANYYEREYLKTENLWDLVKASSNLRKANESDRAIALLENKNSNDNTLMSAILTTRGGAYRDINEVEKAEASGKEAIRIASKKNFYPYNLLGAIYFQKGMPEDGDKYFKIAIELGSSTVIMDREIEKSFKNAGEDEKIRVAKYLLNKDEQKYQWVKYYIK